MKFVGELLGRHLARYPRMELADIYKLLHQAALGSGHAVSDVAAAREALLREATALGPGPDEPLADPISPDGRIARVHLRPYVAAGDDLDQLARAFVETAQKFQGSPEKLAKFCGCLGDLAAGGGIPFARDDVVAWFAKIAQDGYPVVRHSPAYRHAYRPAYRVVHLDYLALRSGKPER